MLRSGGFTLVELVVIILLLGVLSVVVLPRFFKVSDYANRVAYEETASAVRYAQKLAVASGCDVQVSISGNSYALQQHATDCTSGAFATIGGHPVNSGSFDGVTLVSTPTSFVFDPMGRSSSGASISVGSSVFSVVAETGYVDAP